jgi:hypothetical protein
MATWLQQLRRLFHRHVWILVIDPPDAPGSVYLRCTYPGCGVRSGGWRHGGTAF